MANPYLNSNCDIKDDTGYILVQHNYNNTAINTGWSSGNYDPALVSLDTTSSQTEISLIFKTHEVVNGKLLTILTYEDL